MTPPTFTRVVEHKNMSGTSLQAYVEDASVNNTKLTELFGPPNKDAYWDDEKGYEGTDRTFVDEYGNYFNLYSRFGSFRVGAHPEHKAFAECFARWIEAACKGE